jgi:hypothetical protein
VRAGRSATSIAAQPSPLHSARPHLALRAEFIRAIPGPHPAGGYVVQNASPAVLSPASGRSEKAPPLLLAGEGWGEGRPKCKTDRLFDRHCLTPPALIRRFAPSAFTPSMALTLRAAAPCKTAVLPFCLPQAGEVKKPALPRIKDNSSHVSNPRNPERHRIGDTHRPTQQRWRLQCNIFCCSTQTKAAGRR